MSGPRVTRRAFLGGLAAGAAWATGCRPGAGRRPNLLLLLTDDQRADALGCMGNPDVRSPHVDALAAEGLVFDRAFVTTSVCPTSRASILTGEYMRRHGVRDFRTSLTAAALSESYPLRLRNAGYRTGFVGKWGVGRLPPGDAFDFFRGFPGQGEYLQEVDGERRHLTDVITADTLDFLAQQPASGSPFCLSVSFKAPHGPWHQPDPDAVPLYEGASVAAPPTSTRDASERVFPFLRSSLAGLRGPELVAEPATLKLRLTLYYMLVSGVDLAVGRIRAALSDLGLADDTVVVYTSDNGLLIGDHGLTGKWVMYEPSIRVPLIVFDPRLPASRRGRRTDEMALNVDLAPSFLDWAGLPPGPRMQGRSLAPLVRGERVDWRDDWFYEYDFQPRGTYLPRIEGVRTRRFKYVRYLDERSNREALYDLESDPLELEDVSGLPEHADVLAGLRLRWEELRAEAA